MDAFFSFFCLFLIASLTREKYLATQIVEESFKTTRKIPISSTVEFKEEEAPMGNTLWHALSQGNTLSSRI